MYLLGFFVSRKPIVYVFLSFSIFIYFVVVIIVFTIDLICKRKFKVHVIEDIFDNVTIPEKNPPDWKWKIDY